VVDGPAPLLPDTTQRPANTRKRQRGADTERIPVTYTGTVTDDQMAAVHADRDQWMRTALSTDRCDRPAAEAAVRAAYRAAGLADPSRVIWMDSPLGGAYAIAALSQLGDQLRDQLRDQLGDQLWGQLWGQLRGQLRGQLGDQLRGQLRGQLGDQLWDQLRDQLWDQLGGQLGDQLRGQLWGQLRGQLWDQLRDQLGDQLRDQLRGQRDLILNRHLSPWYEAYWLCLYRHALSIARLPHSDRLDTMIAATKAVGWWWPMTGAVILTDRPTAIHLDTQARLHNPTGPALAYADGYDLWSWHGTRVTRDVIEGRLTPVDILREPNAEIRRCAIEVIGWDEYIQRADLRRVGPAVPDPGNPGQYLALYDVPESIYDEPVRVLLCTNGTVERDGQRRRFGLTVPADIADPIAAAAWGYHDDDHPVAVTTDVYAQLARRC
jgi:hypothetical protein